MFNFKRFTQNPTIYHHLPQLPTNLKKVITCAYRYKKYTYEVQTYIEKDSVLEAIKMALIYTFVYITNTIKTSSIISYFLYFQ